ncbi:MAG: hypothetical protein A2Y33_04680 [Spirochaetes bacterium GWF1_51_8]|nr:MAG: hypothetical protein A2Y33_04680 [Spirochaetes bacterium GWF1_51_8]
MEVIKSVRKEIMTLNHYVAGRMPGKSKSGRMIKLASNENRFGSSPKAMAAVRAAAAGELSIYPDSKMNALRAAVCGYWERLGVNVSPQELLFGDGSGEVLNMLLAGFAQEGGSVLFPVNSFMLYRLLTIPKGAQAVMTLRKSDYSADLDSLAGAAGAPGVKAVILSNPDNPTSTFYRPNEIAGFMDKVPAHVPVILDEAYIHFAGMENSAIKLLGSYENLILIYTFSKCYGLAGLRVGYGVMRSPLAEQIEKLRLPFNLGTIQQAGAAAALGDDEFLGMTVRETARGREYLTDKLKALGLDTAVPGGNFIFVDLGMRYLEILEALDNEGISVRSLSDFGFGDRFARITVGTMEENELLVKTLTNMTTGNII